MRKKTGKCKERVILQKFCSFRICLRAMSLIYLHDVIVLLLKMDICHIWSKKSIYKLAIRKKEGVEKKRK